MAQNKQISMTVSLTGTYTTNILYPGTFTGGTPTRAAVGWIPQGEPYIIIRHMRATNADSTARTVRLAIGATGATPSATNAFNWYDTSVPANGSIDWYGSFRLDGSNSSHYLVGGASTTSVVMLHIEGEVGFA